MFRNFDSSLNYAALPAKFISWLLGVEQRGTDWTFAHVICSKLKGRKTLSYGLLLVTRIRSVSTINKWSSIFTTKGQNNHQYLSRGNRANRMLISAHRFLKISSFRRLSFSSYRSKSESRIFLAVLRHVPEVMRNKRPNILVNMDGFITTTAFPRKLRRRTRIIFCEKWNSCSTAVLQPLSPWSGFFSEFETWFKRAWVLFNTRKEKNSRTVSIFFPNPVRRVGKLKLCLNIYINPLQTKRRLLI